MWIVIYILLKCFIFVLSTVKYNCNCVVNFPFGVCEIGFDIWSVQLEDSRIHLIKVCLSAVLVSFGKPSIVKDWDACLASAYSCLYMR